MSVDTLAIFERSPSVHLGSQEGFLRTLNNGCPALRSLCEWWRQTHLRRLRQSGGAAEVAAFSNPNACRWEILDWPSISGTETEWHFAPTQPMNLVLNVGATIADLYHGQRFPAFIHNPECLATFRAACRELAGALGSSRAVYAPELASHGRNLDEFLANAAARFGPPSATLEELGRRAGEVREDYFAGCYFTDAFQPQ